MSRLIGLALIVCLVAIVVSGHGPQLWALVEPLLIRLGDWLSAAISARTT